LEEDEMGRGKWLEGKSVIVTGGGRGIGEGIAVKLAAEGANVCIADINVANAEEAVGKIETAGGSALAAQCDVVNRDNVKQVVDLTVKKFGRLDGIVNNAGIVLVKTVLETTDDDLMNVLKVNTLGVLVCMQEAAKQMIAQGGGGSIVNLSSIGGKQGYKMFAGYCASKFGVVGLTQSAAKEWGEHQIRVNAICPGIVHTPMWDLIDRIMFERGDTQRIGQALQSWVDGSRPDSIILGRLSVAEDLAGAAAFLVSDDSAYMTGQSLVVDGGMVLV
jgi:meso-butanediol dehydrogenase/(S,S)-butanediol dehydrogenase/diacetyl reductase